MVLLVLKPGVFKLTILLHPLLGAGITGLLHTLSSELLFKIIVAVWYVCMNEGAHMPLHACGVQRTTLGSQDLWVVSAVLYTPA